MKNSTGIPAPHEKRAGNADTPGTEHRPGTPPFPRARFSCGAALMLALASCAPLALAGCGFTPLYAAPGTAGGGDVTAGLDSIHIDNIPNREGQYLRNQLIDRFYRSGRPADPAYRLKIDPIAETLTDLDITKSSSATRAQLRLNTHMTLRDAKTGQVLLDRPLVSVTSYNILQSQFTTRVSEENTRNNALDDLARQIEAQLALYLRRAR